MGLRCPVLAVAVGNYLLRKRSRPVDMSWEVGQPREPFARVVAKLMGLDGGGDDDHDDVGHAGDQRAA